MKGLLLLSSLSVAGLAQMASAQLVIDMFTGSDPMGSADWTNAGVTEDLSGAAGGTIGGGNVFSISNLTVSMTGQTGGFNGSAFANNMLNDYIFYNGAGSASVSFGGFETGGIANTLTTGPTAPYADLANNTFTLATNTTYKLYLFGAGDSDGQNTEFTFNGETKSTSERIVGTAENAGHFATFEFTTGPDLTGFTLDFTFGQSNSDSAALNGLAIVDIPEPTNFALFSGVLALAGVARRRKKA